LATALRALSNRLLANLNEIRTLFVLFTPSLAEPDRCLPG